jgi:Zn-dependent M16 (insulinase) family peptidase
MDPYSRGYTAMLREFTGITDDDRHRFRNRILNIKSNDLTESATCFLLSAYEGAITAVCATEEKLRRANEDMGEGKLLIESLF